MRKHPPDVNVSETCIDANLKMVERRDPDNFPRFPPQELSAWTIPELPLRIALYFELYRSINKVISLRNISKVVSHFFIH